MDSLSFNTQTQRLGKLCKYSHNWEETGKSLRWNCDNTCVICKRLRVQQKRQTSSERLKVSLYEQKPEVKQRRKENRALRLQTPEGQKLYKERTKRTYYKQKESEEFRIFLRGNTALHKAKNRGLAYEVIPREKYKERLELLEGYCIYCGEAATLLDHLIPFKRNGGHLYNNLVPSCYSCNDEKRAKSISDWYPSCNFFDRDRWNLIQALLEKANEFGGYAKSSS